MWVFFFLKQHFKQKAEKITFFPKTISRHIEFRMMIKTDGVA